MNSEIPNVLKLSPVTVVKTSDKQAQDQSSFDVQKGLGVSVSGESTVQNKSPVQPFKPVDGSATNGKDAAVDSDAIKKAAEEGNSLLQATKRNLQFKVDDATEELIVKVVDSESGELVRQIPSQEMLDFVRRMQELDGQQGSVLQDRA